MTESMTETATTSLGVISSQKAERLGFPFILILIYLFMEYVRPADPMKIPMVISVILFFSWVTLSRKNWSPQAICFVLILCVIAAMGPFAMNTYSIWIGFYTMAVQLLCICLPIIHFVRSPRKIAIFVGTLIALHVYLAIFGIIHGGRGPGGHIGDENDLALGLGMVIPFAFFSIFLSKRPYQKALVAGIFGLLVAGVISTHSRGGFLGLLAILLYLFLSLPKKKVVLIPAVLLGLGVWMTAPDSYWTEMNTIIHDVQDTEQGTGALRREYWFIARRMFYDNPILGVGFGNYPWNVNEYQTEQQFEMAGRSYAGSAVHSVYFAVLAELGIAGSLIFVALLWHVLRDTKLIIERVKGWEGEEHFVNRSILDLKTSALVSDLAKAKWYAHAIRASLLGYLIAGMFLSVFAYPHFWILTALSVALKEATISRLNDTESHRLHAH